MNWWSWVVVIVLVFGVCIIEAGVRGKGPLK